MKSQKFLFAVNAIPVGCASALLLCVVFALTLMPSSDVPKVSIPNIDKVVHFLMFGALACVFYFDVSRYRGHGSLSLLGLCALASALTGIAIEVLQGVMGLGRSSEWADIVADAAGALLLPLPFLKLMRKLALAYSIRIRETRRPAGIPETVSKLYHDAFPSDERRPWSEVLQLIDTERRFHISIIRKGGDVAGFINWWNIGPAIYIEHFATLPSLRSQGIGSMALTRFILAHGGRTIVLEAEPAELGHTASRRINFYCRHGFTPHTDFEYIQPPYTPESLSVRLTLLTQGERPFNLQSLASSIKRIVYRAD